VSIKVGVFIDGSNFLGALSRANLGYPALAPLLEDLVRNDTLAFARFYAAPPPTQPYRGRFEAFRAANRHLPGLTFFQGYRNKRGEEKAIDVALAVDLVDGCAKRLFDRAAVIAGDGDHTYALLITKRYLQQSLRVYLLPGQPHGMLAAAHIPFTQWSRDNLMQLGIAEEPTGASVPSAHTAPPHAQDVATILTGALGRVVPPQIPKGSR
jgi:hypothetical protein